MVQTAIVNPYEYAGLQVGELPDSNYISRYVDTTTLTLASLIGFAYTPDGIAVVDGDQILFTGLTALTGTVGRGVYQAVVVAGKISSWIKIIYGQSPIGNSTDGDRVFIQAGITYAGHTFECISTPLAIWQDLGLMKMLTIKDEGVVVEIDTNEMNFVGEDIVATSTGANHVQVTTRDLHFSKYTVTNGTSAAGVNVTLATGVMNLGGTSTIGGDIVPITVGTNAALLEDSCSVKWNGTEMDKGAGLDVEFVAAGILQFNHILNVNDILSVSRKY